MKLKINIRAGKIRPNHNVTVRTAASSLAAGRIAARVGDSCNSAGGCPSADAACVTTRFWSDIIATPGGQDFMRLRGKENPMKLQNCRLESRMDAYQRSEHKGESYEAQNQNQGRQARCQPQPHRSLILLGAVTLPETEFMPRR